MFAKRVCLLLAASLSLAGSAAFAQPGGRIMELPPAFKMKLDANQAKLNALEQKVDGVLGRKSIRLADESIEKEMYAYAQEMKAAFDEAQREAEAAGKSKGQRGNTMLLEKFEMMAKSHEVRTNSLAKKFDLIEAGVKKGQIVLEKPVLMRLSPAERNEFKKSLAPEGIRKMEGLHPDIFQPGAAMPGRTSMNLFDFNSEQVGCAVKSAGKVLADGVGDFFVKDAEAACLAPCVGPCLAQNWGACAACCVVAGPNAIQAWNEFVGCWNGSCACKWYKPWCCARKAWCLSVLINKLA